MAITTTLYYKIDSYIGDDGTVYGVRIRNNKPSPDFEVWSSWTIVDGYPPWNNNKQKIVSFNIQTSISPKYCRTWFRDCTSLTNIQGLSNLDTSNVTDMTSMFNDCQSLTSLDLSSFDTSNVTDMIVMFYNCKSLTSIDVSSFNTSNVTDMSEMFGDCQSLTSLDLSSFDTSNVTDISYMFNNCQSLTSLDLSGFDTSKVESMSYMFGDCQSLTSLDLSGFDTSKVESMTGMFNNCQSLTSLDLSGFDTSKVTIMEYMFYNCSTLNIIYFPLSSSSIPVSGTSSMFINDQYQHFLMKKSSTTTAIETFWRNIASQYSNVHYEFDDTPLPVVSNLSAIRVSSNDSRIFDQEGRYAYLSIYAAFYSDYMPTGYTNELKLPLNTLIDNTLPSSTPNWTFNSSINKYEAWIQFSATDEGHSFIVSASDSIKENNVEVASRTSTSLSYTLSKIFTLVDYYHESNSGDPNYNKEGIAFGKYATNANLFDVDMPSRFRDSVIVDKLIGEIKAYAGITIPTGWLPCDGHEELIEDFPLLAAALGADHPDPNDPDYMDPKWGTPTTSYDYFKLPDLSGKVPVGLDENDTDFGNIGNNGGTKDAIVPYHNHSVAAVSIGSSGAHTNHTLKGYGAVLGSGSTGWRFGSSGTQTATGIVQGGAHTHSVPAHNTNYEPNDTNESNNAVGANLQPYAVVQYIICAA